MKAIMFLIGEIWFLGKVQEDGNGTCIEDVVLVSFITGQDRNGNVQQLPLLRKIGTAPYTNEDFSSFDFFAYLDTSIGLYDQYVELTSGIKKATPGNVPADIQSRRNH